MQRIEFSPLSKFVEKGMINLNYLVKKKFQTDYAET